jgi:hypothetical protein
MTEKKKYELVPVDTTEITEIMSVYTQQAIAGLNPIDKAIAIASGTTYLAEQMKSPTMVKLLKNLAGSPLGFFHDKKPDEAPYQDAVYVQCATQALITGHRLTGYEWGIIRGRLYSAKAFFERALSEMPGLKRMPVQHSDIEFSSDKKLAYLTSSVDFEFADKKETISKKFTVSAGQYASIEQIEGKAERKMLCVLYKHITGNNLTDADFEEPSKPTTGNRSPVTGTKTAADSLEEQFAEAEDTQPVE